MFDHLPLHHKLALLDPNAYDYIYAPTFTWTVPAGTTWYALNLWFVNINGVGDYFHRELNVFNAMVLPAGTVITQGTRAAFAYICKPETVAVPGFPEMVFAQRMDKLRLMPLHCLKSAVPVGTPLGTYTGAAMPNDFTDGLWRHVSTNDVAWTILVGNQAPAMPPGKYDSMNTLVEINDTHVIRFTGNILCPFKRSRWNGIWTKAGTDTGVPPNATGRPGTGIIAYNKLGTDWWQ